MNLPQPFPSNDADLCVKCGLCLPACPTYAESGSEADSPRGRIALMQGLVGGLIPLGDSAERHLDGCLSCRSCEAVCPAQVPYGRLIDAGRAWMRAERPNRQPLAKRVAGVVEHRRLVAAIGVMLWLYQASGLRRILRPLLLRSTRLGRLDSLLQGLQPLRARAESPIIERGASKIQPKIQPKIQLFVGCLGRVAERSTIDAAVSLLAAAGYAVEIPQNQTCCGALRQHDGEPAAAERLLRGNLAAFPGEAPIVAIASGCALGLRDGSERVGNDPRAVAFRTRLDDVFQLLLLRGQPLNWKPLRRRIAVQLPCTQRFLKAETPMLALLRRLPGVDLQVLPSGRGCCGAAGLHFLTHAAAADSLLEPTLDAILASQADIVVSANLGCRLHIAAGLARHGQAIEVLHPLELLHRQLS